ncbi:hypothetical protein H9623_07965 [Oerskovia sp. Sa1BUA8]|uniref:Uncharacterized protein n=1 Tax=Oerskovia douganii TaxID=2762210 RepID=A0A9D5UC23_9CELL|nr:hypothetical protein [Oerskovia douganii]MBE7700236.1 hypothetical protein [Oerskovia douganii]
MGGRAQPHVLVLGTFSDVVERLWAAGATTSLICDGQVLHRHKGVSEHGSVTVTDGATDDELVAIAAGVHRVAPCGEELVVRGGRADVYLAEDQAVLAAGCRQEDVGAVQMPRAPLHGGVRLLGERPPEHFLDRASVARRDGLEVDLPLGPWQRERPVVRQHSLPCGPEVPHHAVECAGGLEHVVDDTVGRAERDLIDSEVLTQRGEVRVERGGQDGSGTTAQPAAGTHQGVGEPLEVVADGASERHSVGMARQGRDDRQPTSLRLLGCAASIALRHLGEEMGEVREFRIATA